MSERIFIDKVDALKNVSDIASDNSGFITGGYAIGLHLNNLDYRWHSDIDIMCPVENYKQLYDDVVSNLIDHPVYCFYGNHDSVVLTIKEDETLIRLHMSRFIEKPNCYDLPFDLTIPKPYRLSTSLEKFDRTFSVASINMLLVSKIHALDERYLYPSKFEYYQHDIKALQSLML